MSDTLTHRALRIEDAAATAELFAATERAEPVDEAFSEQDMVEEFSGPRADLERGSLGIYADGRLIAVG
jgi:mycothiol synthase